MGSMPVFGNAVLDSRLRGNDGFVCDCPAGSHPSHPKTLPSLIPGNPGQFPGRRAHIAAQEPGHRFYDGLAENR